MRLKAFKIPLAIWVWLISSPVIAEVNFRWIGTTTFALSDGESTLLFDPFITTVSIWDLLPWRKISTDQAEVDYWFKRCDLKRLDGVIVNHAHYDHALDAAYVVKKYGGKLYGSSSTVNIGLGGGLKTDAVQLVNTSTELKIGKFKVKFFSTPHSPHFLNIMLADGHISSPLSQPVNVWDYKVGDTFSFLIEHPEGKILYQSIARVETPDPLHGEKADILLLTIANRRSTEELVDKRIIPSEAKLVIPLHHDNFLIPKSKEGPVEIRML
jgi:L-ascorbate metabolism protein UlaG (beta-lactamase superfamily)